MMPAISIAGTTPFSCEPRDLLEEAYAILTIVSHCLDTSPGQDRLEEKLLVSALDAAGQLVALAFAEVAK